MNFGPQTSMFKGFNNSIYHNAFENKDRQTIFGGDFPMTARGLDSKSSACCVVTAGGTLPSGGFQMNEFYSTIWKFNLRNVLSSKMAFGESCCV